MAKPEATFVRSINKLLPEEVDFQSMAGTYTNGVADSYYDGPQSDLWVEYKFIRRIPRTLDLVKSTTKPHLTRLQSNFLIRRFGNGRKVAVIVGYDDGGVIFDKPVSWLHTWSRDDLLICSRVQIAEWIESITTIQPLLSSYAYVSRIPANNRRAQSTF